MEGYDIRRLVSRSSLAGACATAGVLLLVFAGVAREGWYAAAGLFSGLALLCVSHYLNPCLDRIAVWRKRLLK
jgi:hypothetical protein